jgi:hypothetical protein
VARALRLHPFRVFCALFVLAAGSFAAAEPHWTSYQIALSFGPQLPNYSEVFFTDISTLPVHAPPDSEVRVPFSIVNRKGSSLNYSYIVTLTSPGVRVIAEKSHVLVKDNQKVNLVARFRSGSPHVAFTITIKINQPYDHIEFHGKTS